MVARLASSLPLLSLKPAKEDFILPLRGWQRDSFQTQVLLSQVVGDDDPSVATGTSAPGFSLTFMDVIRELNPIFQIGSEPWIAHVKLESVRATIFQRIIDEEQVFPLNRFLTLDSSHPVRSKTLVKSWSDTLATLPRCLSHE